MLMVPVIYIKDKQAFSKSGGTLKLLGPAVETIKKLSQKYELFHIIDLDLKKGNLTNFDVYDKLTYSTHIEVECEKEEIVERLLGINARAVIELPSQMNLDKFNKKLLVGVVRDKDTDVSKVNDVIIENAEKDAISYYQNKGKRIMLREDKWDKKTKVWAVILTAP